ALGSGRALAIDEVGQGRIRLAMLVVEDAVLPPAADEAGAEYPAMARAIAIEIAGAGPGQDGREVFGLIRRDHPLARRVIGDAEQADLAVAPGLRPGPFDRFLEVLELLRRVDVELAGRAAGAAAIDLDHGIAMRHPDLGIRALEHHVLAGGIGDHLGMTRFELAPALAHELRDMGVLAV